MESLYNKTQNLKLSSQVFIAKTLYSRTKGLLGKSKLEDKEILWILSCNSIHTFFMQFAIDCVFLDKNLLVCAIRSHIPPWRILLPIIKARSVLEMKAGKAKELNIQLGDQMYVGH